MKIKLLRSIFIIIVLLTLASLTTYAVFTAAPITLANNTISTGSVNSVVCDQADGSWRSSVNTSFAIHSLIPGEENEQELTGGKTIFLGNDGGNLRNSNTCDNYFATAGNSDISIRFSPKVSFVSCPEEAKDSIRLDFDTGGILRSGYKTLRDWSTNTELEGPVYGVNEAKRLYMYTSLDINSQLQNVTCQFDVIFQGVQASEEN